MIEWSGQQSAAIKKALAWAKYNSGPQVHRIFGYAGTGKTTLAKEIANEVGGTVLYGAFTGKAASVMRRKGCSDAQTIHSMIYKVDEDEDGNVAFRLDPASDVSQAKIVIIDECSMIDEKLGKDLLSFGTKVLVLGDPAQLPPVKGTGFFTDATPNTMLTEVHRQARDNPIIRLSMQIREGQRLAVGDYGSVKVITKEAIDSEEIKKADQIIVGLNRTRSKYNARLRELLGRQGLNHGLPVKGDKLVCLRNDRKAGVLNGTIWFASDVKTKSGEDFVHMRITPEDETDRPRGVKVRREFFNGTEGDLEWNDKRGTQEFTYGYALTCHKSQGSQWDNIIVFDEGAAFREDSARWRYTAVTRAAETLTMVVSGEKK